MAFLIQRGHEFAHGLESHLFRNVPVGQAVLAEEHVHVVERRVRVDADALQRLRVGVAGMPRNVEDQYGDGPGHHRIKLPLGRAAPFGDVGIVEIVDHNPVVAPHPFGLPADQGVHVLEVRDARTAAVRFPHGVQRGVAVRVDEAGVEGRALEVDGPAAGPASAASPSFEPTASMTFPATSTASATVPAASIVTIRPFVYSVFSMHRIRNSLRITRESRSKSQHNAEPPACGSGEPAASDPERITTRYRRRRWAAS